MAVIIGIDPGTTKTGWVAMDDKTMEILDKGVTPNLEFLKDTFPEFFMTKLDVKVGIEMIASQGMAVGKTTFETCVFIGCLVEKMRLIWCEFPKLVYRKDVKIHLCNSMRAKDANIRQALLDKYPATGGGKTPQIGTKSQQGMLYGMNSHMWPALGVAMVVKDCGANLDSFDSIAGLS